MKRDQKIYELLNQSKTHVENESEEMLSTSEREAIRRMIRMERKEKGKNDFNRVIRPWVAIAAVITLIFLGLSTPFGARVYAVAEGMLDQLRFSVYELTGRQDDIRPYMAKGIGSAVEVDGIEVKLDSMMVDNKNNEITVVTLLGFGKEKKQIKFGSLEEASLRINGKMFYPSSATGHSGMIDQENHIESLVIKYAFDEKIPEGPLQVDITYSGIRLTEGEEEKFNDREIRQKICFSVEADTSKLAEKTFIKEIGSEVKDAKYGRILIEKLQFNPVTQKIFVTWELPKLPEGTGKKEYKEYFDRGSLYMKMITEEEKELEFGVRSARFQKRDGKYVIVMEMEFEEVVSEITAMHLVEKVKVVKAQMYHYEHSSVSVLESSEKVGEPFTLSLR